MKKYNWELDEINDVLDTLVGNTNVEMDVAVLEEDLSNDKIRKIATERITIKRIKSILNSDEHEEKEKE